ncbi:hypothetical protein CIHG_09652 [Coccidioides immitis H538.4]|uniref:Uncharacterized protein n=1 Tax=Coccidioides immitis H538.4 TaxID=396776 RepID=A0A0J8S604_COCIT|nr:hypothetical protein CIHG_09652 [Coccidioides immitis H538.4]
MPTNYSALSPSRKVCFFWANGAFHAPRPRSHERLTSSSSSGIRRTSFGVSRQPQPGRTTSWSIQSPDDSWEFCIFRKAIAKDLSPARSWNAVPISSYWT